MKESLAAKQALETSQMEQHFIGERFQMEREKRSEILLFQTPRIISQEALMAFLLAATTLKNVVILLVIKPI